MNLVIGLEARFLRSPDGGVWTDSTVDYAFWRRYLDVFDRVTIVARARTVDNVPTPGKPVLGDNVSFCAVPWYVGPRQYLASARAVRRTIGEAIAPTDAVIARLPGQVGAVVVSTLRHADPDRPYGVEVVGDPADVFARGAIRHPLRPLFQRWFPHQLRSQVRHAAAAAYVNEATLPARYPARSGSFTTHYSSIDLGSPAFAALPRAIDRTPAAIDCVMVGSLEQMYKAPDVVLDAIAARRQAGQEISLAIIGDGKHRAELEHRARSLGIEHAVTFLGQLPAGDAVRDRLDRADLFILPSRTEGLPRAMIEAMARGLPCIGSTVGGIPELLPPEDMVPPGDAAALAAKIREVTTDPARMTRMSVRNLERAEDYRSDLLRQRRIAFYQAVRDRTDAWVRAGGRP